MKANQNIDIIIQGLLWRDQYSKEKLQEDPASEGDEWETKRKASRVNDNSFSSDLGYSVDQVSRYDSCVGSPGTLKGDMILRGQYG